MKFLFFLFRVFDSLKCRFVSFFVKTRFEYYCWKYNIVKGKNVVINSIVCPSIECRGNSRIIIGDNVVLRGFANTSWYCNTRIFCRGNGVVRIEDNAGLNGVSITCNDTSITIGKYVHIGGGTRIYDSNFHSLSYEERRDPSKDCALAANAPVVIEDDAFIGTNVIIGKGVTVGARSIIAAGSVVTKDIPADCLAGGNPCKVIKMLNVN